KHCSTIRQRDCRSVARNRLHRAAEMLDCKEGINMRQVILLAILFNWAASKITCFIELLSRYQRLPMYLQAVFVARSIIFHSLKPLCGYLNVSSVVQLGPALVKNQRGRRTGSRSGDAVL